MKIGTRYCLNTLHLTTNNRIFTFKIYRIWNLYSSVLIDCLWCVIKDPSPSDASLTIGPAVFAGPDLVCVPANRPFGLLRAAHLTFS